MKDLPPINIPEHFNYIAVFLSFACTLRCTYCINHHGGDLIKGRWMNGEDWIRGLNRLNTNGRGDLPITLQGGEPTVHKHFYSIIRGVKRSLPIDILTNLEVDPQRVIEELRPERLRRTAPYASIRVSYHHGQSDFTSLVSRVKTLSEAGFSIGIWEVDHPDYSSDVRRRRDHARSVGIDYRIKEFLGPHKGVNYGTMRYPDAVNARTIRSCECRTSELLIDPNGNIFRCHSDLYANRTPIGHILDPKFSGDMLGQWAFCPVYGKCNSCDIKVTTNRLQEEGHTSVEIRDISSTSIPNDTYVEEVVNTYGKQ